MRGFGLSGQRGATHTHTVSMSIRSATAAERAPTASGATHMARLLAYDGPITERNASERPISTHYNFRGKRPPVSNPTEYIDSVNALKGTLDAMRSQVKSAYDRHLQSSFETVYQEQEWRETASIYQTLVTTMGALYANMATYVTPTNYAQTIAEGQNNPVLVLYNLIDKLDTSGTGVMLRALQNVRRLTRYAEVSA